MFIGHFALGLAASGKRNPSLGTAFLAVQLPDLLWPFFLLTGHEHVAIHPGNTAFTPLDFVSYPYSHSLLATCGWAALFAALYYLLRKDRAAALLLGLLVVSHWVLDFFTHRPDLPLSFTESTRVGLGLWNSKAATLVVEVLLFAACCYRYHTVTVAKNKTGRYAWWALVVVLLLIYFLNAFGPPPPSTAAISYAGFALWLLVAWGYWVDRNRAPVAHPSVT